MTDDATPRDGPQRRPNADALVTPVLETQPQSELHFPRRASAKDPSKIGRPKESVGYAEVCAVQHVENLPPKLHTRRMPDDPELWKDLAGRYKLDLFCGAFLQAANRGFALPEELIRRMADRRLAFSVDIYCSVPDEPDY